jgi:hypothetical protein
VERRGWRLLRINRSYHIYGKPDSVIRLSILGLLRHLAKLAEIAEDEVQ